MKRTTVYLEESADLAVSRFAKRRGQAKAELIRQALTALIEHERQGAADEAAPSWLGAGASGKADAREYDAELLELLERDHEDVLASYDAARKASV